MPVYRFRESFDRMHLAFIEFKVKKMSSVIRVFTRVNMRGWKKPWKWKMELEKLEIGKLKKMEIAKLEIEKLKIEKLEKKPAREL